MPKADALLFDNLEDVQAKFQQTICYYEKKSVMVKSAHYAENAEGVKDGNKFQLAITPLSGRVKIIQLEDPALNYKEFNLGYANCGQYAVWWYRKPIKQYRQGLKRDQLAFSSSEPYIDGMEFTFSKNYTMMLENDYPNMEAVEKWLRDKKVKIMAFHKDFALTWDYIHEDFILEYRGSKIGTSINGNLKEFRLLAEFRHLAESLQEALG